MKAVADTAAIEELIIPTPKLQTPEMEVHHHGHVHRLLAKIYADTTYFDKPPPSLETNIKLNEEYIGEFLNKTITTRASVKGNLTLQETIKSRAERLIALIKKKYHLQDE